MARATSSPPAPMASMPIAPAARGVAVGAQQRFARLAESLLVNRMTDAVAGPAKPDAEALGRRFQETGGRRGS